MSVTVTEQRRLETLTKKCARCGVTKPWADFPVRRHWPDGTARSMLAYCRVCQGKVCWEWQQRNRWWVRRKELKQEQRVLLDAGPLAVFLAGDGRETGIMAEASGVSERTIRAILKRERPTVELATADQIITRLGGVFALEYPIDE